MDNVTHSLIGYALGRAATRTRSSAEQRAGLWASIVASNAPDLDFIIGLVADNTKLAYLAHHRGHTHTLLLAIPIGIACAAIFVRAFSVTERAERLRVYALAALAGLLHIGFDWLNNYGVHPFYPLDNRWYYGDAVFIIEPLLFAALLPLLAINGVTPLGRRVGIALCIGVLALVWRVSLVPFSSALAATIALAGMLVTIIIISKRRAEVSAWLALGAAVGVVAAFGAGQLIARDTFTSVLHTRVPRERIAQLVLTPSPANPLCWSALAVTSDPDGTYRGRFGYASLSPSIVSPDTATSLRAGRRRRRFRTGARQRPNEGTASVVFDLTFEGKLNDLRALAKNSCEARILLQFARAPFWIDGSPTVAGDLRFDHEPELAFAELAPTTRAATYRHLGCHRCENCWTENTAGTRKRRCTMLRITSICGPAQG